ncbi:hypothetical protein [Planomicrobium okeanokoites]|uniref:Uncharacterized protein n=1 Tax=Planomicrobium okeanokoites TaxID=244 RepID=A0ABV7KTH5_PLAOK|nr:hypothetical protein [Planomicrobium okeanokoites]TAA71596.1 hypothetical protein D2910_04780 [Planomicrobium okeanokoites]
MRYSDRITFVNETAGGYNPDTGSYDEGSLSTDVQACNLSNLGVDRTNQLFGTLDKEITVARLQRPYKKEYDHALIGGKKYAITRHVPFRSESVFYLEGMA